MNSKRYSRAASQIVTAICVLMAATSVRAHLMVEQHGTVNFANGGAFLVVSLPVSAFDGVDDDGDGAISAKELSRHTAEVEQQIRDNVQLLDESGAPLPLQGLLLSLVSPDHAPTAPARQLIALGRYPIDDGVSSPGLRINLQGESPEEQRISITATRDGQSHEMVFTPDRECHTMFPNKIVVEYVPASDAVVVPHLGPIASLNSPPGSLAIGPGFFLRSRRLLPGASVRQGQ